MGPRVLLLASALLVAACVASCAPLTGAQRAALETGSELIRCSPGASRVGPDRGGQFTVSGCGRRVVVHCAFVAGATVCQNPDHERERQRDLAARVAAVPAAPASDGPTGSAALSGTAGFRVEPGLGGNDVLALDLLFGPLALRVRTSVEHREQVLVSLTLTPSASSPAACTRELTIEAAGEATRYPPSASEGATTHYVIPADVFASFGPRVPLRWELCGNRVGFGHLEIRALRAFIQAHAEMRARMSAPSGG
jgi:hypothetical protein